MVAVGWAWFKKREKKKIRRKEELVGWAELI